MTEAAGRRGACPSALGRRRSSAVAMSGFAQDGKKADECCQDACKEFCAALHAQVCPEKDCKSEKCKEICGKVCENVKAVGARCMEACKKEGLKCEGCEKAKGPCAACKEMSSKILIPWLKNQMKTKDAVHVKKGGDDKEVTTKCTLVTGPVCDSCVEAMTEAMLKACKAACAPKK